MRQIDFPLWQLQIFAVDILIMLDKHAVCKGSENVQSKYLVEGR